MDLLIFSIQDTCSKDFSELRLFSKMELAQRWFRQVCAQSPIADDLKLYQVGTFNTETGITSTDVNFVEYGVKSNVETAQ